VNIAVCICTCDRPAGIDQLLTALERIDLPSLKTDQLEIIVVDNLPDGRARAICRAHEPRLGATLHFCEEHKRGISFARNRAITEALARGADFVAFLDDDDVPRSDWLLRLLEKQKETGAEIVSGIWRLPDDFRPPPHLAQVQCLGQMDFDRSNYYGIPHCGCNVLIGRAVIERLAGQPYRPQFAFTGAEDIDFFLRAHAAGAPIAEARTSVVTKDPGATRATLIGALRHSFCSGCNRVRLTLEHLPPERAAKLRRRLPKRLAKSIRRLSPFSLSKSVAALDEMAWVLGEVYGALGGKYAYYKRRSSSPIPVRSARAGMPLQLKKSSRE
jgi:succinoglycan biosynthesis protein ExoM